MSWKQIQSNVLRSGLLRLLKLSTPAFLLSASCLVGSLALPCSASEDDSISEPAAIDMRGLSLMVAGLQASGLSSGNITNDVAAILAILQQYNVTSTGLATYPRGTGGLNLSRYLWTALFDGSGNDGSPTHAASWLRKIYNALPTNAVDFSTLLYETGDIRYLLGQIVSTATSIESETYDLRYNSDHTLQSLSDLSDYLATFEYGHGSRWNVHIDDYQWSELINNLVDSTNSPFDGRSWGEFSGNVQDSFSDMIDYLEHIDGDFHTLLENAVATSLDESAAAAHTTGIAYDEQAGADEYDEQLADDTSDFEQIIEDNEPDFEVFYTQNPMEPLTNAVEFSAAMRSRLPNLDNLDLSDHTRIYFFKSEWDTEHMFPQSSRSSAALQWSDLYIDLSGSDPRVPNQLLQYASTAMAWAWNLAACMLAFLMLRQFWDWVAGWRA